jgi:RimJ/RimL family protein N-acetyltransferase
MTGAGYRPTVADVDDLRLPDGTPVSIRPLVAADRAWLAAAVERLSPASRYRRFMSPLRTLDETMLVRLVDQVDGRGHVALVGTLNPGSPAEARGAVARFVRWPDDPTTAEMAVTVTDVVQGRGLGRVMARELADRALAAGVVEFTAMVGADNTPSLRMLAGLGAVLEQAYVSPGVLELRVALGSPR